MLVKLLTVLLIIAAMLFLSRVSGLFIRKLGDRKAISYVRVTYVIRIVRLALFVLCLLLLMVVLGWQYPQVYVFLSSIFAVIGVAMFAQWSMLSNLTASLLIFFGFPYRVGDRVRVMEKDDDISGRIEEIGAFHVLIRRRNGDLITYPNSIILQKPVIKIAEGNDERLVRLDQLGLEDDLEKSA